MNTGSERVDAIMRGRRMVLFGGFVACMEDTKNIRRADRERAAWGGRKKRGVSWMTSELLVSTLTSGRL